MSLNKGKHIVLEIDDVLCTVVESGISSDRLNFLKELLEFNSFDVNISETKNEAEQTSTFTIGVTDLKFNPVISVYQQSLKRPGGGKVSPTYWNQETEIDQLPYFDYRDKNEDAVNDDAFLPNAWAYRTV